MNPDTHRRRARSFGSVADAYDRARPGYPPEAVAWLAGEPSRDVVDLGAGTGKLTRQLVAAGHRVTAIEPLPEMRAMLERAIPGVPVLAGTGEAMPFPNASADVVTVAQAFHWFDQEAALAEIARVLRPGGTVGIIWNARDDDKPWVAELSDAANGREGIAETHEVIACSGPFGPVEHATFSHVQRLDLDTLRDLVLSRSHCAILTPDEQRPILDRVEETFAAHAQNGEIELPYLTDCFRAVRH